MFKKLRAVAILHALAILHTLLLAPAVSANAPPSPSHISILLHNLPEDVVYADLLIQITPDDPNYVHADAQRLGEYGFDEDAEIVRYDIDGFRSFTFHYKNAYSRIRVYERGRGQRVDSDSGRGHIVFGRGRDFDDLKRNYSTIKLAFLNAGGEIISVSNQIELPAPNKRRLVFSGLMEFDYQSGEFDLSQSMWPRRLGYGGILLITGIVIVGILTVYGIADKK